MRNTKKTFCKACMCYGLTWTFLHGRRSLSSSLYGMKLVLLPTDDNDCWHLDWGHVTVVTIHGICLRQRDNSRSFGMLLRRSWWNLLSSKAGWWYSRGTSAWSLHPYTSFQRYLYVCTLTVQQLCGESLTLIGTFIIIIIIIIIIFS